jgi:hypothetical protein
VFFRFEEEKRGPFGNLDSDNEQDKMHLLPKGDANSDSQDSDYKINFDERGRIQDSTERTYGANSTPMQFKD